MRLKLTNNSTKVETILDNLEDKKEKAQFWAFDVNLPSPMPEGEYTYELYDAEKMVASGLLQIGDYVAKGNTVYENNEENGYIVYDGE